jgi:hypothetical protein
MTIFTSWNIIVEDIIMYTLEENLLKLCNKLW